jgi:hypothetical protein
MEIIMRSIVVAALAACLLSSCLSAGKAPRTLSNDDGSPDGQRSIAGASEIVEFAMPMGCSKVTGAMIYGSRYGYPTAPAEDFQVTVSKKDGTQASIELVPYSTFERASDKWYTITFKKPIKIKGDFVIAVNFNAQYDKGVYVSFDSTNGNKHSFTGSVSSMESSETGGEWMIRALVM